MNNVIQKNILVFKKFLVNFSFLVSLLYLLYIVVKSFFIVTDPNLLLHWDFSIHLNKALEYYELLSLNKYSEFFTTYSYYPPLLYWIMAGITTIFGYSRVSIPLINTSFLILLLYFFSKYVKTLTLKQTEKKFVFFFFFSTIITISYLSGFRFYEFMLDLPSYTLILSSVFLSLIINNKKVVTYSELLILTILINASLLLKWTNGIFLIFPILILIRKIKSYKMILLFLGCTIFINFWYIANFNNLKYDFLVNAIDRGSVEDDPFGISALYQYIHLYWELFSLTISLFVAALISYYNKIRIDSKKDQNIIILFFSALIPLLVFSFVIKNFDLRFIMPSFLLFSFAICFTIIQKINYQSTIIFFIIFLLIGLPFIREKYFIRVKNTDTVNFLNLPTSVYGNHPLELITQMQYNYQPKKIAYFFEDDSRYFNYASVPLYYRELLLNTNVSPEIELINSNTPTSTERDRCSISSDTDIIAVFSNQFSQDTYPSQWHSSFEEACADVLTTLTFEKTISAHNSSSQIMIYSLTNK